MPTPITWNLLVTGRDPMVQLAVGSATGIGSLVASPLFLSNVSPIDAYHLRIQFSVPVVEADALDLSHYYCPGLDLLSVETITTSVYRITTSRQTELTAYSLTASAIYDLNGNLIN